PARVGAVTATLRATSKNRAAAASDTLTGTGKSLLGGAPGHIYWSTDVSSGTISAAPLTGGTPATLVSGQNNPAGVAVDASNVYWATGTSPCCRGAIWKKPLAGGFPTLLAIAQGNPAG